MLQNSLFVRALTVAILIVVLIIPLSMIHDVVVDRSDFRRAAIEDIARSWTGEQTVIAPLLILPFEQRHTESTWDPRTRAYRDVEKTRAGYRVVMADTLNLDADVRTQIRYRGIFGVPVYDSAIAISGTFTAEALSKLASDIDGFAQWGVPQLSLGIADLRGVGTSPELTVQGLSQKFAPGIGLASLGSGIQATLDDADTARDLDFNVKLTLRGSQRLNVAPIAGNSTVKIMSDWQHPKFAGRFLPVEREIGDGGFSARWDVSAFSTSAADIVASCEQDQCAGVESLLLGVSLIETVNVYAQTKRATKYGILFLLLTFVAFFLTEILTGRRLHPIHYLLVGAALAMFYLLLISLAEHIGFTAAYAGATLGCTALIGVYLVAVLRSRSLATIYAAAIAALYAMLFMILRSEDYALLMGSLLSFGVLALVMLSTRHTDWHAIGGEMTAGRQDDEW